MSPDFLKRRMSAITIQNGKPWWASERYLRTRRRGCGPEAIRGDSPEEFQSSEMYGRLGGEEFVMIFTHTSAEGVLTEVERIRAELEAANFNFRGYDLMGYFEIWSLPVEVRSAAGDLLESSEFRRCRSVLGKTAWPEPDRTGTCVGQQERGEVTG